MAAMALIGGIVAIGLAIGIGASGGGSGGNSGGGSSGSNTTSYVPRDTGSSTSKSGVPVYSSPYKNYNPHVNDLKKPNKEIKNAYAKSVASGVMKELGTIWNDENHPGIDICRFSNGRAQCQSAAVLQALMNINIVNEDDNKINRLIQEMKRKSDGRTVDLQNFLSKFKNANIEDNDANAELIERFLNGKLKSKDSDGHGGLKATGNNLVGSASDYLSAVLSLLAQDNLDFELVGEKLSTTNILNLTNEISANIQEFLSISNIIQRIMNNNKIAACPRHLLISFEGVLPATVLYILKHYIQNKTFSIAVGNDVHNYKLKSVVLRNTPSELITEGDIDLINKNASTHFTCVVNVESNNPVASGKFIKIDSLTPSKFKSCSNDNLLNLIKDRGGQYYMPVIMMFEKTE